MCSPGQSPREQVLAELAAIDPAGLPAGALVDEIARLAAFADQVNAELARLAAALDAVGAQDYGHASAAAFLRTVCGRAPGRASELVTAGKGLSGLPDTGKALAAGEISFDQALVVTRTAADIQDPPGLDDPIRTPDTPAAVAATERILLDAAAGGVTVGQLRQLGEEIAYRANPERTEDRERRRWEKRHLSFGLSLDNTGTIHGACGDTLTFETIRTAAEAFGPPGGALDARTTAQRRLDGLAAACRTALDTGEAPIRHGAAPHISVLVHDHTLAQAARAWTAQAECDHTPQAEQARYGTGSATDGAADAGPYRPDDPADTATRATGDGVPDGLQAAPHARPAAPHARGAADTRNAAPDARSGAPPARTGHGQMLTASQVLALCCGAELTAIRWEDGLPLDVGRAARTEPPSLRKALEARDRTCRWPGCDAPGVWATAHHIRGWAHGAKTSLGEMCLLCHLHHAYFVHQLGWTITGDPNATLHFTHPSGSFALDSPLPGEPRGP